jgi:CAAX protease family protein
MGLVALTLIVIAAAVGFASRPAFAGPAALWIALGAPYLVLAVVALVRMWRDGTFGDRLKPRWGDLSVGVVSAALLLMASWGAREVLAPAGTPRNAWLLHIYIELGPPNRIQNSIVLTGLVLLVPLLSEVVWRGMVLDLMNERFGTRRGWWLAALAYTLAVVPSAFTLSDPTAGLNPLLVVGAFGCGLAWSFIAAKMDRLPAVIISHAAFVYFSVVQFRWPGM